MRAVADAFEEGLLAGLEGWVSRGWLGRDGGGEEDGDGLLDLGWEGVVGWWLAVFDDDFCFWIGEGAGIILEGRKGIL